MKRELKIGISIGIFIFIIILIIGIYFNMKIINFDGFNQKYYNEVYSKREIKSLDYNPNSENTFKISDELTMSLISTSYSYDKIEFDVEFKFSEESNVDPASLGFNSYIYDDKYFILEDSYNASGYIPKAMSRYFYEEKKNLINMTYDEYVTYSSNILNPRDHHYGPEKELDVENNSVLCKFKIEDDIGALKKFPIINLAIYDISYQKFDNPEDLQNLKMNSINIGNIEYLFKITR